MSVWPMSEGVTATGEVPGPDALKSILEHLPLPVAVLDLDLRYVAASCRWRDAHGLGVDDFVGLRLHDVSPRIRGAIDWRAVHGRLIDGATEHVAEERIVRADGSKALRRWTLRPWRDAGGSVGGILVYCEDSTEGERRGSDPQPRDARLQADAAATKTLADLAMTFARDHDMAALLHAVVDAAIAITGADFGNIQLLDPATGDLRIAAQRGYPPWWIEFWSKNSIRQGASGMALAGRERVVVEDVECSSVFAGKPALEIQRRAGVRALQCTPLTSHSGRVLGVFSTHYRRPHRPDAHAQHLLDLLARQAADLIERIQTEETLRLERDKLQALIDNAAVGIVVAGPAFEILTMNAEALRIHGFDSQEELLTQLGRYADDFALLRPDGRPLPFDDWPAMRILRGEACVNDELVLIRRRDGQRLNVRYGVVPITGADGQILQYLVNVLDLTDVRQAQQRLTASEERLALALASANAGSWDWDVRSGTLVWSAKHYELFGYPVGAVQPSYEVFSRRLHPDDLPAVEAHLRDCRDRREATFSAEFRVVWPDGSLHWVDARGRFHFDAEGPSRMYGVVIDGTERKRVETELRRARDELEQRVHERTAELRQRGDQLARLASELVLTEQRERRQLARTLHDGLQQLLVSAKYELDSTLPRLAADVLPSVQRASAVLDESIKSSRLVTVELSPPILHDAGLAAGLQWLARWKKAKHGLAVDLQLGAPDFREGEEVRLLLFESVREVLFNVVKHAGVREALVMVSQGDGDRLRVVVSDEGCGFDATVPRQAADPLVGGFGLFSIRERLSLLGGSLHIESAPGKGTRVMMEVPSMGLAAALSGAPTRPPGVRSGGRNGGAPIHVLLVDDHPVVRQGLSALLSAQEDIQVVGEAANGQEAIALAGELEPDVILMDHSMPGMSGVEATRQIHARWPWMRIVGLSMHDEPTVAAAMRAAGAAAYTTKGGDAATLLAGIRGGR